MGWEIGPDNRHDRFVGYGVPCFCDYPGCNEYIDRGLSHICGNEPYGGGRGCGLFFCDKHLYLKGTGPQLCERCTDGKESFEPKPEHPEWLKHVLTDVSWNEWRDQNPKKVEEYKELLYEYNKRPYRPSSPKE